MTSQDYKPDGTPLALVSEQTKYNGDWQTTQTQQCAANESFTIATTYECHLLGNRVSQNTTDITYYGHRHNAKLLPKPKTKKVTSWAPGNMPFGQSNTVSQNTKYEYYSGSGRLEREILEEGTAAKRKRQ